jgi:hypothetical protein
MSHGPYFFSPVFGIEQEQAHMMLRMGVEYVDGPASDTIRDWIRRHEATGGAVAVVRTLRPGRDVMSRPRCAANRVQPARRPVPAAPGPR